jgi:hypothetical protein
MELRPGVCVESAVIVQNVYKVKLVSYPNIIIIRIVGRRDLHGTSSKSHVDDNVVRHYWNTTVYERVDGKLAVKMLWRRIDFNSGLWPREVDNSPYNGRH